MILLMLGATICYAALTASTLLITTENWWTPHPTTSAAILTLGLVPMLSTWAAAETIRLLRKPKLLTSHSHPLKRLLLGLTIGLTASATGALLVVLLEPNGGGLAWLLMAASALISTSILLWFTRRTRPGHCRRCDYDLAGVTIAAHGKCPECGLDQMTF